MYARGPYYSKGEALLPSRAVYAYPSIADLLLLLFSLSTLYRGSPRPVLRDEPVAESVCPERKQFATSPFHNRTHLFTLAIKP